jgi:hypothetical protein
MFLASSPVLCRRRKSQQKEESCRSTDDFHSLPPLFFSLKLPKMDDLQHNAASAGVW